MALERSRFSIESSSTLSDKEQEGFIADRIREGFSYEIYSSTPISWAVDLHLRRERPMHKDPPWFRMKVPVFKRSEGMARFDVTMYPNVIQESQDWVQKLTRSLETPQGVVLQEGDFAEMVGFYLKLLVLNHEVLEGKRRDLLFQGKQLTEYPVGFGLDDLWIAAAEHYFTHVITPREAGK